MKRQTALTRLAILLVTVMLTACGFHLRGSALHDDMPFQSIYITGFADSSSVGMELKRSLQAGGTTIATDRKTAEVVMNVLSDKKKRNILSLNAQGRVREYELAHSLRFRVLDAQGSVVLSPTTIIQKRKFNYTESEALARVNEQETLYQDMQSDLVQQILRHLSALKLNKTN